MKGLGLNLQGAVLGSLSSRFCGSFVFQKKIKIFRWRACNNILPTKCNLVKRKIIIDDKCHIYTREVESVTHALWGCATVQDVWAGSISKLQMGVSAFSDFMQLMEHLVVRLSTDEMKLFSVG